MAIDIICDDCGSKYRVNDDKAGAKVRCKECGSRIDVPNEHPDFETPMLTRSGSSGRKKRKGGSGGVPTGTIIGVGAITAVLVIGIVVYSMLGKGGGPAPQMAQNNPPAALPNSNPTGGAGFPQANPAPAAAPANTLPATPTNVLPVTPGAAPAAALPSSALPASALPSSTPPAKGLPSSAPVPPPAPPGRSAPQMAAGFSQPGVPQPGKGFGGFDGTAPSDWTVKVDPSKSDTTIDSSKPITIRMPKGAGNTDIVFPVTPSVFVALGCNVQNMPVREIWNLATRSKSGTINNSMMHPACAVALSPDGQYLAANILFSKNKKEGVAVWMAKGNKALGELETSTPVSTVMFASPERLLAIRDQRFTTKAGVCAWKIPSGTLEYELDISVDANSIAISPGGNYAAVVEDHSTLQMFDLNTGKPAGELKLATADTNSATAPDAMSFSPDGQQLAIVTPMSVGKFVFHIYDVAEGKLLSNAEWPADIFHHTAARLEENRLQWFPDHSKLLWMGHYIIDAKLGAPVWSAPQEPGSSDAPRKLLDEKRILVAVGGRQNAGLKVAPIPLEEIDSAVKVVAAGGEASDAGMPTLLKTDQSSFIPIAANAAAVWSMKPDPAGAGKAVKASIPVPKGRPSVGGLFVSRPDAGRAVAWYTDDTLAVMVGKGLNRRSSQGGAPPMKTAGIDIFDLVTGKVQGPLLIGYPSTVVDVSPDGGFAAVLMTQPKAERIDVYDIREGKLVGIGGWRPFQNKEDFFKEVTSAVLLDDQFCLTQNFSRLAYMWKLPECKAVWRMADASNYCLSPGGKYLGFQSGENYAFMDPRTGDLVGNVAVGMSNIACAFHPVGTHFALLGSDPGGHKIMLVDVATGKSTGEFYIPHGESTVQWCGDTCLLVDGKWLVDLKQQKVGWNYELAHGMISKTQPDGRHWFFVGPGRLDDSLFLSSATVPEPATQKQIDATQLPDESLLKPGMQINLQVNVAAASPKHANLATEIAGSFRTGLEKKGFQVGAGSPYTIVVSTTQTNPGGSMEFQPLNGGGNITNVPIIDVQCDVSFQANGQALWTKSVTLTNRTFGVKFLDKGEDITTSLTRQLWDSVGQHFKSFPTPAQAFNATAGAGLGKSTFVPGGTQPAK